MKIYLAAIEQGVPKELLDMDIIKNGFISYFYARSKPADTMSYLRKHISDTIVIDSGAHSFFSENEDTSMSASVVKRKKTKKLDPDIYFKNYISWLKANYDYYDYFVELDIGELISQPKVMLWRDYLKSNAL